MSQVVVNMKFQADTTQAKAKMQELQNSLKAIGSVTNQNLPMNQLSSGLEHAKVVAAQLQVQLRNAFNQDTGKLDLSRFVQQMNQSGMSLEKYKMALMQAGPIGQKAFAQLATSVASADTHVIRISERFAKLGQTLANTMRWQISSKALMAVTSTISNAYRFAQDLNKSLNNIRIVTGKSAEEMEKFAEKANDAAKALNTTTTKYTDAALIFFQQGLSEKKAIERTNTTIKLANITGQSVEEISNQLTAIWNNFDDGTKPLEYYADVITALGAATASSSKEISEGLEKFAAVGETVGLSYEYATAALATVTATTRQSADVVGTAFKTLFARIQDLELGNTLDDGTTLGQYSQALEAVGINIKNANGEVKDMNIILDEMGAKWGTLSKDAQIALAQNVAGVRQYTQLMALMENYDFFKENLKIAQESSGALQEQADIYGESWKAARDEVTAALEDIYKTLLDDDAFIDILHFFADFIENIGKVIDSVGGLRGVLLLLTTALINMGKVGIANWFNSVSASMMSMTAKGREALALQRDQALAQTTSVYDNSTATGQTQNALLRNRVELERSYLDFSRNATAEEAEVARILKDQVIAAQDYAEQKVLALEATEKEASYSRTGLKGAFRDDVTDAQAKKMTDNYADLSRQSGAMAAVVGTASATNDPYAVATQDFHAGVYSDESLNKASAAYTDINNKLNELGVGSTEAEDKLKKLFGKENYNIIKQYHEEVQNTLKSIKELQGMDLTQRGVKSDARKQEVATKTARLEEIDKELSGEDPRIISQIENDSKFGKKKHKNLRKLVNERQQLQKEIYGAPKAQADQLDKGLENTNKALENQGKELQENMKNTKEATDAQNGFMEANKKAGQEAVNTGLAVGESGKKVKDFNEQLLGLQGPLTFGQKMTTMASMAMSAAMAIQSLKSVIAIWNDEDASFGDKILQTMMSLGMVIPMVTRAFSADNAQRMLGITITKTENGVTVKSTGGKIAQAIATRAQTKATQGQTVAQNMLNASMAVSLSYFALVLAAVAAIIGIVYLLIKAFEKQQTAAEKAKDAYKAMSAGLEQLNEQLDETKTKLEEVKTLFENYIELENSFDKLIEGSDAYNENLQKQQELVRQLIKEYPELVKYGLIDPNTNKIVDIDLVTAIVEGTQTVAYIQAQVAAEMAHAKSEMAKQEAELIEQRDKLKAEATDVFGWTQEDLYTGQTASYITYKGHGDIDGLTYTGVHSYLMTITNDLAKLLMDSTNKEDFMDSVTEYASTMSSDWLKSKEDFIESVSVVFDQFCEQWEEIQLKNNDALKSINETTAASLQSLAGTINSNIIGYANLSSIRQGAANKLLFDDLKTLYQDFDYQIVKGKTEYGEGFKSTLEQILGEELADTWIYGKKTGDKGKGTGDADVSWNLEHTNAGKALVDAYLESRGVKRSEVEFSDWTSNSVEIDFGGETGKETVQLATIMETAVSKFADAIGDESLAGNIKTAGSLSNVMAAGLTGQVNYLTQEEVDSITELDGEKLKLIDEYEQAYRTLREGIDPDQVEKELINLTESLNQYDASLAKTVRLQEEMQKGKALIATEAEKYDLDAEMLERYADTLKDTQDVSYETAAAIAISSAKISKGVDKLRDVLEDSIDTLKNYDVSSYEFAEAAAEVGEALELMFGAEVSNNKIKKWAESGDLEKLANGGQEALDTFEKLRLEVGKDYVASLHFDQDIEKELQGMLDKLDAAAKEFGQGHEFDLEADGALETLQKLLDDSKITVDQIKQMFGSIGWEPEIDYVDELSPPSRTMTGSVNVNGHLAAENLLNNPKAELEGENLTWTVIETRSMIKKPVLKDANGSGKTGATYTGGSGAGLSNIRTKKTGNSSKSKKQTKNVSKEAERYHEIKEKLSDLNREYDKLGELKDRAFGQSHLDYLDEEAKKLDQLIDAQKQYIDEIKEGLKIDKAELAQYGASFDSAGRITNYDKMVAANVQAYNKDVNAFNSGRMSEEQFEKREEAYEKFMDDIAAYEETLNLLEDEELELFNKQNERFDKSLEKAEYVVEYGTSLVEDSLSIIEYQLEKIEDKAYSTAEALALMGQKMNEVSKKSDIYKEGIEATLAASGLSIDDILGASSEELAELVANGTFTAEQVEQLRNYRDELLNTNQEMKDMANETLDKLLEGFDEWNEAIDKNKEKIDHLKEVTSSYRDIIDLIGKDNLGVSNQMLEQMNKFNIAASQNQVDITRRQLEENKRSLEEAREEYRNAASEEEKYYWGKVVESLEETVMRGENDLLAATQDSLNTIQEAFKDTLTNITEEFEKAISGMYGSLEALQAAYDQRTDERERYLEDYAKIYELSKLTRDINKSMDESDSIRGKQRLLEIQEEINALQESGVEMTQFEVDELRARYDLRLAEIALEEAQNAKSQVRMTRDSEGNWSYTYTADQDAIDSAQQNYEDKLYAYQNLTTEYIYDLESQIMEIPSQLSEALQAIWEDTTLTDEEKEARAQEAIDFYTQKDTFLKEQMEKAIGRSKELYDKDWKNYSNATGYKISADEQWMDSFDETVLSQITGFKTLEEYQQAFASSAMTMANDMRTAYQAMTSNIDKTLQNMGTSMATFAQDLQGLMNTNKQKIEEYTKEVDDDIEKMGTSSAEAMEKAADNWALYADYVANSAGANENLATALNNVITAIGNVTAPLDTLKEKYQEVERQAKAAAAAIASIGGNAPGIDDLIKRLTVTDPPKTNGKFGGEITLSKDKLTSKFYNGEEYVLTSFGTYVKANDIAKIGRKIGQSESGDRYAIIGQMIQAYSFDTGGYTGSWDSSGRLAMLHQKELVLNADDTKNFLAAVNIVRELSAAIDLKALAYQNALGQMSGAIRMSHEPQRLQQDVTIHAEFPNVTERNEIEAAFNSLMNQATQYVHRK